MTLQRTGLSLDIAQRGESVPYRSQNEQGDLVCGERSVHHKPVFRMDRGELAERLRNSGMVQETRFIDPIDMRSIGQSACQTGFRRHIDEDPQVRIDVLHREGLNRFEIHQRKVVATSLIGQRRIDKAVGDDHITPIDRRSNELGDMLRSCGAMQQRLSTRFEITQISIEEKRPDGLANRRAAGLSGQNDGSANVADAIREHSRLRRLAGTVDTFKSYELSPPHLEGTFAVKLDSPVGFFPLAARTDVVPIGELVL